MSRPPPNLTPAQQTAYAEAERQRMQNSMVRLPDGTMMRSGELQQRVNSDPAFKTRMEGYFNSGQTVPTAPAPRQPSGPMPPPRPTPRVEVNPNVRPMPSPNPRQTGQMMVGPNFQQTDGKPPPSSRPGMPGSATGPTPNIGGMPGSMLKKGGKVMAKPVAKKAGGKVAAKPMGKPVMKKAGGRVAAKPMAKGRKR